MHDMNDVQRFWRRGERRGAGKEREPLQFSLQVAKFGLGGHCGLKIRAVEWNSRMEDCDVSLMA